jgi:hypothetical protein
VDSTGHVLAPTKDGKPVRFKVTRDGAVLGENHAADSAPDGTGEVRDPRLYQLIWLRTSSPRSDSEIEFLDPGIQAFSFTFG